MLLFDQRKRLRELLHSSLAKAAAHAGATPGNVYAFVVYPDSGYVSMYVAFSTRESLARRIDEASRCEPIRPYFSTAEYYELNADEWEHSYGDSFAEVNELLDRDYYDFHEAGIEHERIYQFFEDLLVEVVLDLKAEGAFSGGGFENDLLLGIQFSDASGSQFDEMERASKALNSPYWHEKFRAHLMALREVV